MLEKLLEAGGPQLQSSNGGHLHPAARSFFIALTTGVLRVGGICNDNLAGMLVSTY